METQHQRFLHDRTRSKPNCFTVTALGADKWSIEKIATAIAVKVAVRSSVQGALP